MEHITEVDTNRYKINSIDKALDLLELLAKEHALNLMELSARLNRPKSSLYRVISTLEERGYITRDETSNKYCLGLKNLEITKGILEGITLIDSSKVDMEDLAGKTGESVNLGVLKDNNVTYVAIIEGIHQLKFTETVGSKAPFHASAIGKAIAANLPNNQISKLLDKKSLKKITSQTIVDTEVLQKELKNIKKCGYAIDDGEVVLGARCIAAPIFDMFGSVKAAISISGVIHSLPNEKMEELSIEIKNAANNISEKLGYSHS